MPSDLIHWLRRPQIKDYCQMLCHTKYQVRGFGFHLEIRYQMQSGPNDCPPLTVPVETDVLSVALGKCWQLFVAKYQCHLSQVG